MINALFPYKHNFEYEDSKEMKSSFQHSIGINEKFIKMVIYYSRFIYQNKEYDIIIIEILKSNKIEINSFLENNDLTYEEFLSIINKKDNRAIYIKNIVKFKE